MTEEAEPQDARPEPNLDERKRVMEALKEQVVRSPSKPVSVKVEHTGTGALSVVSPHSDELGWTVRLNDTFGTASHSFAKTQLLHLVGIASGEGAGTEAAINSMLASVGAAKPSNEMEAQLVVQMAATHQAAMQSLTRATNSNNYEVMEAAGNLANKLLRTYAKQAEALAKLQRGGQQKVTVEHVHVYQGGQAIVGNVSHAAPSPDRGAPKTGSQPHALVGAAALAFSTGGPVLCPDEDRELMHVASGEREGSMPDAHEGLRQRPRGWLPERSEVQRATIRVRLGSRGTGVEDRQGSTGGGSHQPDSPVPHPRRP
jgi:hypothetical protein